MDLKTEITTDPLGLGYAGMGAEEILESLTNVTRTRVTSRMVSARAILSDCPNGAALLDKLDALGAQISAVKWAMFFIKQEAGLDAGHPATLAMLTQLQQAGALTEGEVASLKALSVKPCSRVEELGLPTPILAEIIEAMR